MIAIKEISFQTNIFPKKKIEFGDGINLIYSDENSLGKTTLIRIILNALGFEVPLTKGLENAYLSYRVELINFNGEHVVIEKEQSGKIHIHSIGKDIELPAADAREAVIRAVFGLDNPDLLNNLLGSFYVDQENGWNVVNRGRIIGSSHFYIEQFIIALSKQSAQAIDERIQDIKKERSRYKQLLSISESASEVGRYESGVELDDAEKLLRKRLFEIRVRKKFCKDKIEGLELAARDNQYIKDVVGSFNIVVQNESGERIRVTKDNIVGFVTNESLLQVRLEILRQELDSYIKEERKLNRELYTRYSATPSASWLEYYMDKIRGIDVRQQTIASIITYLQKEEKALRKRKKELLDINILKRMSMLMESYLAELNVRFGYDNETSSILERKFDIHSGAERSKRVFAFKLTYVKIFEELFNIFLPIIVDSPYSKETDGKNFKLFMNLLRKEFGEHQIIIASIHDDILDGHHRISLVGGLLDGEPSWEYVMPRLQGV